MMTTTSETQDDDALHEFETEIARMSQDTDAILDSIRQAVQPTAPVRQYRSLQALLDLQKQQYDGHGHNDTDDDDMTDDGSVPEEVRRKIQDELSMLDTKYSTDPDAVSQEIRQISMDSNLSPLAVDQYEKQQPPFFLEAHNLWIQVVLVWSAVILILARVFQKGLLDENGVLVLPFLSTK